MALCVVLGWKEGKVGTIFELKNTNQCFFLMVGAAVAHRFALAAQHQLFRRHAAKRTRQGDFLLFGGGQRQQLGWLRLGCHSRSQLCRKALALGLVCRPERKLS